MLRLLRGVYDVTVSWEESRVDGLNEGDVTFTCVRGRIVSSLRPRSDGGSRGVEVAEVLSM